MHNDTSSEPPHPCFHHGNIKKFQQGRGGSLFAIKKYDFLQCSALAADGVEISTVISDATCHVCIAYARITQGYRFQFCRAKRGNFFLYSGPVQSSLVQSIPVQSSPPSWLVALPVLVEKDKEMATSSDSNALPAVPLDETQSGRSDTVQYTA